MQALSYTLEWKDVRPNQGDLMRRTVLRRCSRKPSVPLSADNDSYQKVVGDFIQYDRAGAQAEFDFYSTRESLAEVIRWAALAKQPPHGKRHPHQRESAKDLAEANHKLQARAADIDRCRSFDELHDLVGCIIQKRKVIGEVTIYDVATRIGAYLNLEPNVIYLHAGTKTGATALGLGRGRATLEASELPKAFWVLKPREIEDCLCIYKERLQAIRKRYENLHALAKRSPPPPSWFDEEDLF